MRHALVMLLSLLTALAAPLAQAETLPDGLVSYWSFDDNTADSAWLYSANVGAAEDSLRHLGGPAQYVPGIVGRAIRLDRSYLTARFSPDVKLGSSCTIEAWIKPGEMAGPRQRLVLDWGGEKGYHLGIRDRQVSLYHKQAGGEEPHPEGGAVVEDKWQHVAAVADARSKRLAVFLDGSVVAELPYDGTVADTAVEPLGVGASAGGSGEDSRYRGAIDELAVWNVALSDETIRLHFEQPQARFGLVTQTFRQVVLDDGPLGYWPLDESEGDTVEDLSGNGYTGTCLGGVVLGHPAGVSVPDGRAAATDGVDDRIDVGDLDPLDGAEAISVEAWVRWIDPPDGFHGVAAALRKEQVFAFGAGWIGNNSTSDTQRNARFWIHTDNGWLHSDNGTTDVDDGRWHHLAGTYDGEYLRIYVDGIQESYRKAGRVVLSSNANPLLIGSAGGRGEFFPGAIDEAAVYDRALSATEVYEHYVFGCCE